MKKLLLAALLVVFTTTTTLAQQAPLPPYTIMAFGAKCDGSTDDSAAINSMLTKFGVAIVPAGRNGAACVVNPGGNAGIPLSTAGWRVTGLAGAKVKIGAGQAQGFNISANYVQVDHLAIDTNDAVYGIFARANGLTGTSIHDNVFTTSTGSTDAYIVITSASLAQPASNNHTERNLFDETTAASVVVALLHENSLEFSSADDRLLNYFGFGISTRWSRGTFTNLRSYAPSYGSTVTQTATPGQTSFTFTASRTGSCRAGIQVNGVPMSAGVTFTPNGACTSFNVTTPAMTGGEVVSFLAYAALEPMNINSASSVIVNGADLIGTGDTGIVIGADYFFNGVNWELGAPASINDIPFNIVLNDIHIQNTLGAGIAWEAGCASLTVGDGFLIRNFGTGLHDEVFGSAIVPSYPGGVTFISAQCVTRIGSGIIDNTSGTGRFGVTVSGSGQSMDAANPLKQVVVQPIDFRGTFELKHNFKANLSLADNIALMNSIDLPGNSDVPYAEQPNFNSAVTSGLPSDTAYWTYTKTGSGVASDAVNKQGGDRSILTIANSEMQMAPTTEGASTTVMGGNKLVKFRFWAKSTSAAGPTTGSYVSILMKNGAAFPNVTQVITSASWKLYEMEVPGQNVNQLFQVRVGSPSGGITANLQYPQLYTVPIE